VAELIFGISLIFLSYTYLLYPLLIFLLSKKYGRKIKCVAPTELPNITVMLCLYNSENLIEKRIENILSLDYPSKKLNIVIVADGCTDTTCQRIENLALNNVKLISYKENKGKSYALAQGLLAVESELILFADARQTFAQDVLTQFIPYFSDMSVGAVTGNLIIEESKGDPGLYWRYEKAIRSCENDYKSLLGVTGAIYMAKKSLLPEFPADIVLDDMYGPLSMVRQGYRVAYCDVAIATDQGSHTLKEEFDRKVRTLAGNFQLIQLLPWILNPSKNPVFFEFISHKLCRLLVPYFLITLFTSSYFVSHWFGQLAFWGQCAFYSNVAIFYFYFYKKFSKTNFILSFVMLNLAALKAGVVYWLSPTSRLWKSH
jgi:biofilm PGA synthesis N-glycosyltransferase PgaC